MIHCPLKKTLSLLLLAILIPLQTQGMNWLPSKQAFRALCARGASQVTAIWNTYSDKAVLSVANNGNKYLTLAAVATAVVLAACVVIPLVNLTSHFMKNNRIKATVPAGIEPETATDGPVRPNGRTDDLANSFADASLGANVPAATTNNLLSTVPQNIVALAAAPAEGQNAEARPTSPAPLNPLDGFNARLRKYLQQNPIKASQVID